MGTENIKTDNKIKARVKLRLSLDPKTITENITKHE
jgi:hypothetical protein